MRLSCFIFLVSMVLFASDLKQNDGLEESISKITPGDLQMRYDDNSVFLVIDCRPAAFIKGWRLPKALHLPYNSEDQQVAELIGSKDIALVLYATNGQSPAASILAKRLVKLGYQNVSVLEGGIQRWRNKHDLVRAIDSRKN